MNVRVTRKHLRYTERRGIPAEVWQHFGIGYSDDGLVYYPYRSPKGKLMGYKVKSEKNKKFWCEGASPFNFLFGSHLPPNGNILIITEGEDDCAAVAFGTRFKYSYASVPNGASDARINHKKWLKFTSRFDTVLWFLDQDPEGKAALIEIERESDPLSFRLVDTTLGKDACDILQTHGGRALERCIKGALQYHASLVYSPEDVDEQHRILIHSPEVALGVSSGFKSLDKLMGGIRLGEIITCVGNSGKGKSSFARDLMVNLMGKWKCLYITLEESPAKALTRLMESYTGQKLVGQLDKYDEASLTEVRQELLQRITFSKLFGSVSLGTLERIVKYAAYEGIQFIVLDHLTAAAGGSDNPAASIRRYMETLNKLAVSLNVALYVVTHPHRTEQLSMSSGFGSSAIEQYSHTMLVFDDDESERFIKVVKSRGYTVTSDEPIVYLRWEEVRYSE